MALHSILPSGQNQIFRCHNNPMDIHETNSGSGYDKPPWVFKGSALYQLHLVKAQTARAFIPKEFRLVEAFGYTLGGFFLASYDDSPAGIFDELVVIAGTVWNPPTSCAVIKLTISNLNDETEGVLSKYLHQYMGLQIIKNRWAARVLVNSDEACIHGRRDVGLPSQVARFSKSITATTITTNSKFNGFLSTLGIGNASCSPKNVMDIHVSEIDGPATGICNITLSSTASKPKSDEWMGPLIKMSLPSFSGRTEYNPHLLKYSCQIQCRVRPISPAKVSGLLTLESDGEHTSDSKSVKSMYRTSEDGESKRDLSVSIMLSKPILALEFSCLEMVVEPPVIISKDSHKSTENSP